MVGGVVTLEWLAARPRRDVVQRHRLRMATTHVGALTPTVAGALEIAGLPAPAVQVGDPLLLAAVAGGGSVWRVARASDPPEDTRELGERARAAWRLSARVAARVLPVLADPTALLDERPPRLTALSPPAEVLTVDGPSVGLSFALRFLSHASGTPIAPDLACSAELCRDGLVRPVDLLPEKLRALRDWAPAVRRVLVAAGQALPPPPDGIELIEVRDLGAAWSVAFAHADFDAALAQAWSQPEDAQRAVDRLHRFVLGDPPTALRWEAVARALAVLVEHVDGPWRWRAEVALGIALRHAGQPRPLPDAPEGVRLRRPHRLQLLAHRLQTTTDRGESSWESLAAEAEREVAGEGEEHPEDLQVLGALGRLYATRCRFEEAIVPLRRAAVGWMELDRAPEGSRPCCALLHIAGLRRDPDLAALAEGLAVEIAADPRTPEVARGYLHFERGRARALLGEHAAALAALADDAVVWEEAAAHVRASRLRWLARLPGGDPAWRALEAAALAEPGGEAAAFLLLARADRGDHAALDRLPPAFRALYDLGAAGEPDASPERRLELFPY